LFAKFLKYCSLELLIDAYHSARDGRMVHLPLEY